MGQPDRLDDMHCNSRTLGVGLAVVQFAWSYLKHSRNRLIGEILDEGEQDTLI